MANAVRKQKLREAIADAIAENVKAYDVASVCVDLLGLEPAGDGEDPFYSKRVYVRGRLLNKSIAELQAMARKIIDEYGDDALEQIIEQLGMAGVAGEMKNLIFAANGPKPRIVLHDAINNDIEITENAEFCLVYDQPLTGAGLSWRELTAWWTLKQRLTRSERDRARHLYRRLDESMSSNEYERLVFKTYAELYAGTDGFDLPALIPQVYLHYDPYTRRENGGRGPLVRQRMDFLLLLSDRRRIVVEVDGRQHYSDDDGRASPDRYAEMVKEDRSLRLAGYEIYRFGAKELMDGEESRELVRQFFASLLEKHRATAQALLRAFGVWIVPDVPPFGQQPPLAADALAADLADGGDRVVGRPGQVGWLAVADPARRARLGDDLVAGGHGCSRGCRWPRLVPRERQAGAVTGVTRTVTGPRRRSSCAGCSRCRRRRGPALRPARDRRGPGARLSWPGRSGCPAAAA